MTTSMDIQIQNKTSSNQVFACITGQALNSGNQVCFIQADGKTPYFPTSPATILSPVEVDCAIPLGAPGSITTLTIPQLAGARIWLSIDQPLKFLINPGPAIVEPSVTNPSDANINLDWTFCEFTFNNDGIYANISYVDFVSLPVSLTLTTTTGQVQKVAGLKPDGLKTICDGLEAPDLVMGADWAKLVYHFNDKRLRVLSPNAAIVMNGGNLLKGYFEPYVDECYSKWSQTPLTINTQAQWGKVSGTVSNGVLKFLGLGDFAKPSTADIFSCSCGPFANNAGATGPLTARISAGFNRSIINMDGAHPDCGDAPNYYKNPVTNHYARLVHDANIDRRGYAFPYDDVCGAGKIDQSGFVHGHPQSFLVTIG